MSLPYGQQEQLPPPAPVAVNGQHSFATHHGRGSFGPVIAVLAVILFLGVISAMIGRLCAAGKIPGLSRYDFEGWFQSKFRSCIDGRTAPPTPPPAPPRSTQENCAAVPIEEPRVVKPKRKPKQPPPEITEL